MVPGREHSSRKQSEKGRVVYLGNGDERKQCCAQSKQENMHKGAMLQAQKGGHRQAGWAHSERKQEMAEPTWEGSSSSCFLGE